MKPGKELDKLIAEKVLGQVPCDAWQIQCYGLSGPEYILRGNCGHESCYPEEGLACRYSISIGAALQVIEKLDCLSFKIDRESCMGVRWDATVYNDPDCKDKVHVMADTAPHAICLAALKFIGEYED